MTFTVQTWHVLLLATILALGALTRLRRSGEYDFVTPLLGCAGVLILLAIWVGWLIGRFL